MAAWQPSTAARTWTATDEAAYADVCAWFTARYEDPVENCPHDSGEGGYQFIYGGPYTAIEEIRAAWSAIYAEDLLARIAMRLEQEMDCRVWSAVPRDEDFRL